MTSSNMAKEFDNGIKMRSLDLITKVVVHCSDSMHGTVEDIRRWHKERGFADIGYHFVIYKDGSCHIGRTIDQVGSHVAGHNTESIGICLIGVDMDDINSEQLSACEGIIFGLRAYNKTLKVFGHRDFNKGKLCPGFNVNEVLRLGN